MKSYSSYKLTPLAAAIAAAIYPIQPAVAQEERDTALEEVIVTATLRETSLQVVPQSITALTNEDIKRNNLQNLQDLVNILPSLGLSSTQPGRRDLVYRGISSGSEEFYTDSQVAVYLDDASITLISQQPWPRFVDIERVESLPGPQATLFGSSSQSGTVRLITNKPNTESVSGEVFGEISTTKGGDMSYEANAWLNMPFNDSFAMRFVAYYVKEGGYIDNVLHDTYRDPVPDGPDFPTDNSAIVKKNQNDWELTGGRISALWNITDKWDALFTFTTESSTEDGTWYSDPSLGPGYNVARFNEEFREDDWYQASLTIKGDLGFAEFTSATAFFDRTIKYQWDNMAYDQYRDSYWGYYLGYAGYNAQYSYGAIFNDQNQDRFSQEFRLASTSDSAFQWMVGLFYEDVHDDWYYGVENPNLIGTPAWYYAVYWAGYYNYYGYPVAYPVEPTNNMYVDILDRDVKQTSVFGEVSFDFSDQWRVVGGARWFEYDRYHFTQIFYPAEGVPPLGMMDTNGIYISESKPNDVLFKASIQYQITDDKMIYGLWSQGTRLGGVNSLRAANYIPEGATEPVIPLEYDADIINNFELGLKSKWLDSRLLFNATLFHMQWDEYQQGGSGFGPWWLKGTFNAADAKVDGIEFNGTMLFTDNFRMDFSAMFADPRFTGTYVFPDGETIEKGMQMPNSNKRKAFLSFDWDFPGALGSHNMFLHYDVSYQDGVWTDMDDVIDNNKEGKTAAYSLSNLRVGANFGEGWQVTLFVRNLFDEQAELWVDNGQDYIADWFGGGDWNRRLINYSRPRTIGFQFTKGWY